MNSIGQHAVVIGASMAGLLTARVLADYYEQVTLIERDTFPLTPGTRKGVPQGQQPHFLLASGGMIMERFFPGLTDELIANGALAGDTDTLLMVQEGGYLARFNMGVRGVALSRSLIEFVVRQRVLALANVRAIQNGDALGLLTDTDQRRVTGVRIIRRDAGSAEERLHADLVVDTSGRGSRILDWLKDMGYEEPEQEKLTVDINYVSRLYRRHPDTLPGLTTVVIAPTPETKRGGVVIAREDGTWHVMLFGYLGDRAPSDDQGFLEFARTLPSPEAYHVIRSSEPVSEPMPYRFVASQRRHFEALKRFPEGLVILGDALCSFNPIYGQGMTVAAHEIAALHACLAQGSQRLAPRFFKAASKVIEQAWEISAGSDLKIPGVQGKRTPKVKFVNWYMSKLLKAGHHDRVVTTAFLHVINFAAPPPSLMHPRIALRVLRGNLRRRPAQPSPIGVPQPARELE
ncbi:MAG TPA: tryptophan 7-halogenase [Aggregatilineales bacterium]|nr:tryptophan 7-halogenase [Aggregatilineales bacterium]